MNINQIKSDIEKIESILPSGDLKKLEELNRYLVGMYENIYRDIMSARKRTDNDNVDRFNRTLPDRKLEYLTEAQIVENYRFNLRMVKGKLNLLIPNDIKTEPSTVINLTASSNAQNKNEITFEINLTFNDVRKQIKDMDEMLDDNEIEEILQKLSDLEEIFKSADKKPTKWRKASAIGKWLFDKSVDVGIALLPLFLKIGQ